MHDQYNKLGLKVLLPSATYSADNTPAAVDISGFGAVTLAISVGVGGITFTTSNKIEFKLTHSDDNSTYTDVEQDHVLGATVASGGIVKSLVAAHATADVTKVGYIGGKKYLKLLADFSGTHGTGTPLGAVAVCELPDFQPVA